MIEFLKFLVLRIGDMICAKRFGKRIKAVSTKEGHRFVSRFSLHNGRICGVGTLFFFLYKIHIISRHWGE